VHLVMFLFLGWAVGYVRRPSGTGAPAALLGLALASEAVQQFTIDRGVAVNDIVQDLLGALVGLATARLAQWRRTR
jgi:VanZ family protein